MFKCIRNNTDELARLIQFTPYSREEYKSSYERSGTDLERARLFLIRANMARSGMQYYSSSWRHAGPVLGGQCKQRVTGDWNKLPASILEAAERLKDAEIENEDTEAYREIQHKRLLNICGPTICSNKL